MRKLARSPQPALAISLIALFVALGGTGYAAMKVTGKDVRNGSLTGKDIKKNALGGKSIKESLLGKVPGATRADRAVRADSAGQADSAARADLATEASRVSGLSLHEISYFQPAGSPNVTIFQAQSLTITAGCAVGVEVSIVATSAVDDSSIFTSAADTDNNDVIYNDASEGGTFDAGLTFSLLGGNDGDASVIDFVYEGRDGGTVTGQLASDESGGVCRVRGTATSG